MSSLPWSGRCSTARFLLVPSNAFWRLGVSPRHRWTSWPMTIGPIWIASSTRSRHRHAPCPIIKPSCPRNLAMAKRSDPRGKTTPILPNPTTATRRSLHDDVTAALKTLGITLSTDALDAALQAAERESLSHLDFLHRLFAEPAEARRQRALERRLRAAKFRELTTLQGFDWEFNAQGVDRRTIEQLVT